MLRLVVAVYLMIVAVAGPTACCCALTHLTTRLATSRSEVPAEPVSCCHAAIDEAAEGGENPPANRPACPCKQGGGCEVDALPATLAEAIDPSARAVPSPFHFLSALLLDQAVSPAGVSSISRWGSVPGGGTSTDDLLYAFHMLRC